VSKLIFPCFTVIEVTLRGGRKDFCDRAAVEVGSGGDMCTSDSEGKPPTQQRGFPLPEKATK
jgi:hypothetical protein